MGRKGKNLNSTVTLPGLYISWGMEKNGQKNGSLNYNTILQLDLFCHKMGKWTDIPYVQAFMVLYQNPALWVSCNQKPGESETLPTFSMIPF